MVDYELMESNLYEKIEKMNWKLTLMGSGLDVSIDINTGVNEGITYSVYLKENEPVYILYEIVLFENPWGESDSNAYEIGEFNTVGILLRKIRSLDRNPSERK